jgi:hypothetical protein
VKCCLQPWCAWICQETRGRLILTMQNMCFWGTSCLNATVWGGAPAREGSSTQSTRSVEWLASDLPRFAAAGPRAAAAGAPVSGLRRRASSSINDCKRPYKMVEHIINSRTQQLDSNRNLLPGAYSYSFLVMQGLTKNKCALLVTPLPQLPTRPYSVLIPSSTLSIPYLQFPPL